MRIIGANEEAPSNIRLNPVESPVERKELIDQIYDYNLENEVNFYALVDESVQMFEFEFMKKQYYSENNNAKSKAKTKKLNNK